MADFVLNGEAFTPSEDMSWRDVNGELVSLNTVSGEYYNFNAVGREIWMGMVEGRTVEAVVERILADYDISDRETAMRDIENFMLDLKAAGLIESHKI